MKYVIEVKLQNEQTRKYTIEASNKTESVEKMKLRLPPKERESYELLSIKPDLSQYIDDDIHGTFLN